MKKIALIFIILVSIFTLSSCILFDSVTVFSNMKEYSEEEVLLVARDKYSVAEWIFIGGYLRGDVTKSDENVEISLHWEDFSADFINGDNIDAAMTAFAGKNGNHDIQGQFRYFICYVALARCTDGSLKYIYYNTNIDKNADIFDTIGASDYNFEVSPTDLTDEIFAPGSDWGEMTRFLAGYKDINPKDLIYSRDKLTYYREEQGGGSSEIEFYREGDRVVYDIFYDKYAYDGEDRRLIYSTSDRYGVIYHASGADFAEYFEVSSEILPDTEENDVLILWGSIEPRYLPDEIIYSEISFRAEYPTLLDGEVVITESTDNKIDTLSVKRGYGMPKSDEIDYSDVAKFALTDFYILYIK